MPSRPHTQVGRPPVARPLNRVLALGVAVLLSGLSGCGPREPAPQAAPAVGERIQVRIRIIDDQKPVAAVVTPRDMAEARARIGGALVRLNVKAGDTVHRGQVLAVVSDPRIGYETRGYEAQTRAAEAENTRAQSDLTRTRDLFEHGVYAQARLDQVQAAARAADAAVKAARAQRAASAESGAQGAILAPSDGRVLRADVPAGSVVSPGQSVATLTSGPMVLRLEIPEDQSTGLRVGQVIPLDAADLGAATATVIQIYPAVTAGRVVADLTAAGLKADVVGRRVAVRVAVGRRSALLIPTRFIITRFGVDYVRLLARDGQVGDAPVQLAPGPQAGEAEVLSGLASGDVLVAPRATR